MKCCSLARAQDGHEGCEDPRLGSSSPFTVRFRPLFLDKNWEVRSIQDKDTDTVPSMLLSRYFNIGSKSVVHLA